MKEIDDKGERQLQPREHVPHGPVRLADVALNEKLRHLEDAHKLLVEMLKQHEEQIETLQRGAKQIRDAIKKHEEQIVSLQKSMPRGIPKP